MSEFKVGDRVSSNDQAKTGTIVKYDPYDDDLPWCVRWDDAWNVHWVPTSRLQSVPTKPKKPKNLHSRRQLMNSFTQSRDYWNSLSGEWAEGYAAACDDILHDIHAKKED